MLAPFNKITVTPYHVCRRRKIKFEGWKTYRLIYENSIFIYYLAVPKLRHNFFNENNHTLPIRYH